MVPRRATCNGLLSNLWRIVKKIEAKAVPSLPMPDPIVIRIDKGIICRTYEVPGKHFETYSKVLTGWHIGGFHGATVRLLERKA